MGIEFGIFLPVGPSSGEVGTFLDDIDAFADVISDEVDSLWMSDHFFWGVKPVHEAWTVVTYLAAKYEQFNLGTLVLGQGYRNPAMLGKMSATLQILSKGRLVLGLGAGWKQDEYEAYGYLTPYPTAAQRVAQLEEAAIIIKRLWYENDPTTYYGRFYSIIKAYCQPKPDPIPPLMIGGGGRNTIKVVAQHANWWNYTAPSVSAYREKLSMLHEHCEYVGRNPDEIRLTWLGKVAVGQTQAKAEKIADNNTLLRGTPNQIVQQIAPFVALGVDYFMFEVMGLDDPETVNLFANDLLPKVRELQA